MARCTLGAVPVANTAVLQFYSSDGKAEINERQRLTLIHNQTKCTKLLRAISVPRWHVRIGPYDLAVFANGLSGIARHGALRGKHFELS